MPPVSSPRRKAPAFRSQRLAQRPTNRNNPRAGGAEKSEHEILFQTYFKSVGPRTYAAQVKKANNDNHYLVLTEGKRDEKTGEVRKARLFIYSEDFIAFFRMLQETAQFIRANPVPEEVKRRRAKFWARKGEESRPEESRPQAVDRPTPVAPGVAGKGSTPRPVVAPAAAQGMTRAAPGAASVARRGTPARDNRNPASGA
jgi:hypothetical protein